MVEVSAVAAKVYAPMVIVHNNVEESFVWFPEAGSQLQESTNSGRIELKFVALSDTIITFGMKLKTIQSTGDSFYLQVDDGPPNMWNNIKATTTFTWDASTASTFSVVKGTHVLKVIAREDGAKVSRIRMNIGDAMFEGAASETVVLGQGKQVQHAMWGPPPTSQPPAKRCHWESLKSIGMHDNEAEICTEPAIFMQ